VSELVGAVECCRGDAHDAVAVGDEVAVARAVGFESVLGLVGVFVGLDDEAYFFVEEVDGLGADSVVDERLRQSVCGEEA
jgi:hypothetical protein